jgi:hypothetical protein
MQEVGMLIEKLLAAIKETHDPLLKECLNEIIRLNALILEMEQKNDTTKTL